METPKTPPPFFQGVARFYPSSLGSAKDQEIMQECIAAAKRLGLNNSVLDIDAKYIDGRGPVILEINCRMGEKSVGLMHEEVFGINLVTQHLRCGCGLEPGDLHGSLRCPLPAASYAKLVLANRSGVLRNLTFDSFYNSVRDVLPDDTKDYLKAARLAVQPGHKVSAGNGKLCPPIMAIVVSEGSTLEEA